MLFHISFTLFCVHYFIYLSLIHYFNMENKNQENAAVNYKTIDGVQIKENSYKDRLKDCERLLEKQPEIVYLCANAKVVDYNLFVDDKGNEKIALQLNNNLVQVFDNKQRKLTNVLFDFRNNVAHIVCENVQLKPLKEYMQNSILLGTALIGAKISFYEIMREGGKTHTLTNGVEYDAEESFFETILLRVEIDEKRIPTIIQTAVLLAK